MAAETNRPRVAARDRADEETPLETPEADAAEQHAEVGKNEEDWPPEVSLEIDVPEADAAEQAREVPEDEDDYR